MLEVTKKASSGRSFVLVVRASYVDQGKVVNEGLLLWVPEDEYNGIKVGDSLEPKKVLDLYV